MTSYLLSDCRCVFRAVSCRKNGLAGQSALRVMMPIRRIDLPAWTTNYPAPSHSDSASGQWCTRPCRLTWNAFFWYLWALWTEAETSDTPSSGTGNSQRESCHFGTYPMAFTGLAVVIQTLYRKKSSQELCQLAVSTDHLLKVLD